MDQNSVVATTSQSKMEPSCRDIKGKEKIGRVCNLEKSSFCFQDNRLSAYCGFKMMGSWNKEQSPIICSG